jgi:hypothetical protein
MAPAEPARATGSLRARKNLVPLPYWRVSYQRYDGAMTEDALRAHLLGREAYRRTDFVAVHDGAGRHALVAVERRQDPGDPLFTPITAVEVLALPDRCRFVRDRDTDPQCPSALARLARAHAVGPDDTLVVWSMYDHVTFIHRPDPVVIRVVEVAPPDPPKLYQVAQKVLSYADLPPILLELETIDLRALCSSVRAKAYLFPCQSGGLEAVGAPVYFLDDRPAERQDWTLIGCHRTLEFHRHFYGDEPPMVSMCPRDLAGVRTQPTLLKCCLQTWKEEHARIASGHLERDGASMVVPWSSDEHLIERALRELATAGAGSGAP